MRNALLIGIFYTVSITNSFALSAVNVACPTKFEGTVVEVKELIQSTYPKVSVQFHVTKFLKGNLDSKVIIEILRDGPLKFTEQQAYLVELSNGYLCRAELKV